MENELLQNESMLPNGWTVWTIQGRIDIVTADEVGRQGEKITARNDKTVLDMSGVQYISSAGLRVLLRILKKAKKEGKEFTVAGATGTVKMVLEDSNMDTLLEMRESLAEL